MKAISIQQNEVVVQHDGGKAGTIQKDIPAMGKNASPRRFCLSIPEDDFKTRLFPEALNGFLHIPGQSQALQAP